MQAVRRSMSAASLIGRTLGLVLCFLYASVSLAGCDKKLSVGWEAWMPYQFTDESGRLTGLDVELVRAIAIEADCQIEFMELPWKRHLQEIQSGRVDMALGASYTEERGEFAHFSNAYRQEIVQLFVRKAEINDYPYRKLTELMGTSFKVGATLGYYYGTEYEALMTNPEFASHVNQVHTDALNYQMLKRNRIDGMLVDPVSAIANLRNSGQTEEFEPLFTVHSADVYMMFSKAAVQTEIVERFNQSLKAIRESGIYGRILDQYLPGHGAASH